MVSDSPKRYASSAEALAAATAPSPSAAEVPDPTTFGAYIVLAVLLLLMLLGLVRTVLNDCGANEASPLTQREREEMGGELRVN